MNTHQYLEHQRSHGDVDYPEAYYRGEIGTFNPIWNQKYFRFLRKQMRDAALYAVGLKYKTHRYDGHKMVEVRGTPCMPHLFIRDAKYFRDLSHKVLQHCFWDWSI